MAIAACGRTPSSSASSASTDIGGCWNPTWTFAGVEFIPGVHGKNIAPQDIYDSVLPHATHSLIRDLGISSLRRFAHDTGELLNTPVQNLF